MSYYHRSYSTLHNGTVVEHGDGFALSFIDSAEITACEGITWQSVSIANRLDDFIRVPTSMLAALLTIGHGNGKFILDLPPDV